MFEWMDSISLIAIKAIGMVASSATGLVMSWISKRSVNYRKIDRSMLISSILFFVYLNVISLIINFIGIILIIILPIGVLSESISVLSELMIFSGIIAIITIAVIWGLILRTKRMKIYMKRTKETSKRIFLALHGLSLTSIIFTQLIFPFTLLEQQNLLTRSVMFLSWFMTIWWFSLIIELIWRTARYVFSEMKITMLDGEVIKYGCSPQMCRVHKNYIRLIKRDESGKIIYERHINEGSIRQIEYLQMM